MAGLVLAALLLLSLNFGALACLNCEYPSPPTQHHRPPVVLPPKHPPKVKPSPPTHVKPCPPPPTKIPPKPPSPIHVYPSPPKGSPPVVVPSPPKRSPPVVVPSPPKRSPPVVVPSPPKRSPPVVVPSPPKGSPPFVPSPVYNPPPTNVPCPPPPPKQETCPIDTLKLGACVDLLGGLVHIGIGSSAKDTCCPLLQGLVDLDAAVCLCTTIKAKLLNINLIIPVALEVLIDCGKTPPPGFQCA
ncbi:36.4 kDa proline-rich protein-like [Aristolochia californica]|uniref:36.4 kDa proline-rich protein-like n=1 Tax=Aristolochia californica TaxID=171875 RepID=UPI0035DEE7BF